MSIKDEIEKKVEKIVDDALKLGTTYTHRITEREYGIHRENLIDQTVASILDITKEEKQMKCSECKEELSVLTELPDFHYQPLYEIGVCFPIEIICFLTEKYKCFKCGIEIKKTFIKKYLEETKNRK